MQMETVESRRGWGKSMIGNANIVENSQGKLVEVLKGLSSEHLSRHIFGEKDPRITMNTVKIVKNFIFNIIFNFNFKILVPIVTEISVGCP